MKQGYSGSSIRRKGNLVEKASTDQGFLESPKRQKDLIALSHKIAVLPRIDHIASPSIFMDYIDGEEGLAERNALRAGQALRLLHDQRDFPHPCQTGIDWLIELANENLAHFNLDWRISLEVANDYPIDALIHSEPVQFIEKKDGAIVFIDFEGIGMGSRYQDLGFIYWWAAREDQPEVYPAFIRGYLMEPFQIDLVQVKQMAGVISLAYVGFALAFAGFAEAEKRLHLGLRFLDEAGLKYKESE